MFIPPSPFVFFHSFFSFSFPIISSPILRLVLETLDMVVGGEDRAVADWKILIWLDLTVTVLHLVVFICLLVVAVELGISLSLSRYSSSLFHHH